MKNEKYLYITNKGSFIRPCPCSPGQLGCNYFIISPAIGCPFNCSYCFLKAYSEDEKIIIYSNTDDMFKEFIDYIDNKHPEPLRIGSGEFMDSLALPALDETNMEFLKILKKRKHVVFEFKTKSTRVDNFLNTEPLSNIILSWSLNPKNIIESEEAGTPSLIARLTAAQNVVKHGYKIAIHFDPIFITNNSLNDYYNLIEILFEFISPNAIAWFSMGGFRYIEGLKLSIMENNINGKWFLFEEFIKCKDGKYRYPKYTRLNFYNNLGKKIKEYDSKLKLYLCMEDKHLWNEIQWGNSQILEYLHPSCSLNF